MPDGDLRYVVVDVFTDTPLAGNPLAVFTDAGSLDGDTMQRLARELNLSETVFVCGPLDGDEVPIRIFTPATELPFAGHPALGTACLVAARTGAEIVRLRPPGGPVPVVMVDGGGEMEQPIPTWATYAQGEELLAALRVTGSLLPIEIYDNGVSHVPVALASDAEVTALAPDLSALAALGPIACSVFCASGDRVHTRMFGPGIGVAEDPATGWAAGPLVVHLARHGVAGFGTPITISQGAELHRPSQLRAVTEGDGDTVTAVRVGGEAVIVAEGAFRASVLGSVSR